MAIYKGDKKIADRLPDIDNTTNGKFLTNNGTDTSWGTVTVPTKTSDLTNDSGFITSSYHDSTKQDVLTAGTDISITNNTINFTGTIPTNISDLTDDTSTNPIDKADTLTGLTATVSELNYTDGVTSNIQTQIDSKQDTLVSGTNIKTINSTSLLGSGNVTVANTNASNFSTTGKSTLSSYGMPSTSVTSLTVGASGTTYTAPANGWFAFVGLSSATNQYYTLSSGSVKVQGYSSASNQYWAGIIPVQKNKSAKLDYNLGGATKELKFIYAQGGV